MPGRFLRRVGLDADAGRVTDRYPFTLPVVVWLARCGGAGPRRGDVLVDDNGTGKSTLIEAVTVAAGVQLRMWQSASSLLNVRSRTGSRQAHRESPPM